MGWLFWVRMAPKSVPNAYVWITDACEKSGRTKTEAFFKAVLKVLNDSWALLDQWKGFFLSSLVKGKERVT